MRGPDRGELALGCAHEHPERGDEDGGAVLQAARRAHTDHLTHDESEIEATDVNQVPFENIRVAAQMRAAHSACVVDVGERAFDRLPASTHQAPSAGAANPAAIAIHRRLGLGGSVRIFSGVTRLTPIPFSRLVQAHSEPGLLSSPGIARVPWSYEPSDSCWTRPPKGRCHHCP